MDSWPFFFGYELHSNGAIFLAALTKIIPPFILFPAFLVFVVAMFFPLLKYMLAGATEATAAAAGTAKNRERWVRYTNRISGVRGGYGPNSETVSRAVSKSSICWLHCRSLLCTFKLYGEFDRVRQHQHEFWRLYRDSLMPEEAKLLRELLWADAVLYFVYGQARGPKDYWLQRYSSDTLELFLAAAAILKEQDQSNLRAYLAEQCNYRAPQLSKLLADGNAEACIEAATSMRNTVPNEIICQIEMDMDTIVDLENEFESQSIETLDQTKQAALSELRNHTSTARRALAAARQSSDPQTAANALATAESCLKDALAAQSSRLAAGA